MGQFRSGSYARLHHTPAAAAAAPAPAPAPAGEADGDADEDSDSDSDLLSITVNTACDLLEHEFINVLAVVRWIVPVFRMFRASDVEVTF